MPSQEKLDSLANLLKEILSEGQEIDSAEFPYITIKGDINGKGLLWVGSGHNKQLIYVGNPDRFFISENIDLARGKGISVNNVKIIDEKELGSSIVKSNLREVGRLNGLIVDGGMMIDQYIVYDSATNRLGLGIEEPNSALSIAEDGVEIVIGTKNSVKGFIGTFANHNLEIGTDNTARITVETNGNITLGNYSVGSSKVTVLGTLAVNITNPDPRAALHVNGAIKFNDKIHLHDRTAPSNGTFNIGDIVWNSDPQPGKFVGWVCVREGSPGVWNGFGRIE